MKSSFWTRQSLILIPFFLLAMMSCQPGAPIVTVIGEMGGFNINETMQILKSKNSKNIFYISGKCNAVISVIQISFDNGSTFNPLSQYAESYTNNCASDGAFSYKINPNSTTAFDIPLNSAFKDFKLRGMGDFGATVTQNFRRMISASSDLQVTAGSTVATGTIAGTPVVLKARIISTAAVTSGSNFRFKGAIKVK